MQTRKIQLAQIYRHYTNRLTLLFDNMKHKMLFTLAKNSHKKYNNLNHTKVISEHQKQQINQHQPYLIQGPKAHMKKMQARIVQIQIYVPISSQGLCLQLVRLLFMFCMRPLLRLEEEKREKLNNILCSHKFKIYCTRVYHLLNLVI